MTSPQFIDHLESKLIKHGARKVVPDAKMLADAYRLTVRRTRMRAVVKKALATMAKQEIAAPTDLERRVRAHLKTHPASSWGAAVAALVADEAAQ
jgi:hypothetical protein